MEGIAGTIVEGGGTRGRNLELVCRWPVPRNAVRGFAPPRPAPPQPALLFPHPPALTEPLPSTRNTTFTCGWAVGKEEQLIGQEREGKIKLTGVCKRALMSQEGSRGGRRPSCLRHDAQAMHTHTHPTCCTSPTRRVASFSTLARSSSGQGLVQGAAAFSVTSLLPYSRCVCVREERRGGGGERGKVRRRERLQCAR